ncbi:glycosyltransferase family 39 protein [Candidatus Woesearchaeota archaeon]|nr:glycosyltransferase family 39 protein [Candidatus Woesearchaeota archaeon]
MALKKHTKHKEKSKTVSKSVSEADGLGAQDRSTVSDQGAAVQDSGAAQDNRTTHGNVTAQDGSTMHDDSTRQDNNTAQDGSKEHETGEHETGRKKGFSMDSLSKKASTQSKKAIIMRYWPWAIIIILLIVGFNLRAYHIDYPSIGYHNMKENIYLMQAYHMDQGEGLFKLSMFYFGDKDNNYQPDMLPLIAWSILLFWKVFGDSLLWPRLLMVLLSLANIVLVYIFVNLLTKKKELGLVSALLMAIMPIGVFFGRNIQPDIPGVTFMLLYSIFFYRWINGRSRKDFIWFTVFLAISFNLKLTNIMGLIPFIFIIPYKDILMKLKRYVFEIVVGAVGISTAFIWRELQKLIMPDPAGTAQVEFFMEFMKGYSADYWTAAWPALTNFISDNFTWLFAWLCVIGLVLAALKYRTMIGKYLLGYFLAVLAYFTIVPGFISRHNYYQSPLLPLVVISVAYLIYVAGSIAGDLAVAFSGKKGYKGIIRLSFVLLLAVLVVALNWGNVRISIDRQFDTQFIGNDVAGEFLNTVSEPAERVFMGPDPSGQTISMLWYAKRYGCWLPQDLDKFKRLEDEKNFRWVFLYGMNTVQGTRNAWATMQYLKQDEKYSRVWEYIENNYRIEQIGAIITGQTPLPYYIMLKKGGSFNVSDFETVPVVFEKNYGFTFGEVQFYSATR